MYVGVKRTGLFFCFFVFHCHVGYWWLVHFTTTVSFCAKLVRCTVRHLLHSVPKKKKKVKVRKTSHSASIAPFSIVAVTGKWWSKLYQIAPIRHAKSTREDIKRIRKSCIRWEAANVTYIECSNIEDEGYVKYKRSFFHPHMKDICESVFLMYWISRIPIAMSSSREEVY